MYLLTSSQMSAQSVVKNIPGAKMETHLIEGVYVHVAYYEEQYRVRVLKLLKPFNIYTEEKERDWWKHENINNKG